MPHVTTPYRVISTAGHHRQPRSSAAWIEPNPQSDAEVVAGTTITPYAPPQLAYTAGGRPRSRPSCSGARPMAPMGRPAPARR